MQNSSQIITTNKPTSSFLKGRMPFQQCQSTEGGLVVAYLPNYFNSVCSNFQHKKLRTAACIINITCHITNSARFNKPIVWSYTVLLWCSCFNFKANTLLGWIAEFQISSNNFCEWTYRKQSAASSHRFFLI